MYVSMYCMWVYNVCNVSEYVIRVVFVMYVGMSCVLVY